jgi:putative transposase
MLDTVREVGPRLGIAPTCAALGVSTASYYRRVKLTPTARPRPTPARALGPSEREAVLGILHEPRFVDLAPVQVYAHLLDEGRYLCSARTMYRLLAACQEVRERRDQLRHPRYVAPQLLATRPNEVWSWDITKLLGPVKWTYFYLYVILDVFSRYVVGWMVAHRESARLAQKLIAETCARQGIAPGDLTLHADRGSSMTSKPVALLLADLGVTKTHSRPHVSNDNPFSEAQFKTLKYRLDFPERFGSIEDARAHCRVFFPWYNTEHRHTGIGLLTAHDVHYGLADQRVAGRTGVLAAAYAAHPDRFVAGVPRPPARPTAVWINPPRIAAASTPNPAPAGSEEDTGALRAPYSHAAESRGPDLRTQNQPLSITRLPAAIANEADEPAMTEAALH